jgi:Transposase.
MPRSKTEPALTSADTTGSPDGSPDGEPVRWAGVDWSWSEHAVCIIDDAGAAIERFTVAHTAPGLTKLVTRLQRHQITGVAIERGDGPVVAALLDAGLAVFVIASRQVTALRSRYGTAGNKDDRFDAYLLADVLRTDRRRLTPGPTPRRGHRAPSADRHPRDHAHGVLTRAGSFPIAASPAARRWCQGWPKATRRAPALTPPRTADTRSAGNDPPRLTWARAAEGRRVRRGAQRSALDRELGRVKPRAARPPP